MPGQDDIRAAAALIAPHVHRTPVMQTDMLTEGMSLQVKLENTQKTGVFKVRGAFYTLLTQPVPEAGVVAASGGNHGASVAFAARALGHRARIYVPEIAGPAKIGLIRETGADLEVVPGAYADALKLARAFEAETGAMQVHAYDGFGTVAGQGTCTLEWEEQGLDADTVIIAVGGGGLIAGAMAWLQGRRKVIAVEPELAPTLWTALRDGPDAEVEVGGIAANALGARRIGTICYDLARQFGVESLLVTDEAIAEAQDALWRGLRQVVEPAGATALAVLRSGVYRPEPGEKVAVLVCGANPAPAVA
ncbi:threonine/serine dehydratase [Roseisalinus antarcticus]|uniref:threonine/serine dehydratase n=1 Tax=Roseisalinus antarcticus TaxID=254357 RepID=UPI00190EC986|nr:threonine/serine dehydratase [Roseisalinus antarcticus]